MNKKILSILLVAAMAASSTAVLADEPAVMDDNAILISDTIDASDEGIMLISEEGAEPIAEEGIEAISEEEEVAMPSFVEFSNLKVVAVTDGKIETVDEAEQTVYLNTHKSVFYNNDGSETKLDDLKAGDVLTAFVRANEPAPLVLPAEYTPAVIINVDEEYAGSVEVATFIPNEDGGYINTEKDLVMHLPEGFVENRRLDNDYIVFYSMSTRSIPPQTTADKVVLLETPVEEEVVEDSENTDADAPTEKKFTDVADDASYAESVYDVVARGLFNGVSETEFMPDGNMTRAMFVTVLGRLDGFATKDAMPTGFSDTPADQYYSTYVVWANENDIVNGYEDGTFRPDNKVTREEAMQIIWNYCTYKGITPEDAQSRAVLPYADVADLAEYAANAGLWNAVNGFFTADENENIRPKDSATRAEVACAMKVLAENIEK